MKMKTKRIVIFSIVVALCLIGAGFSAHADNYAYHAGVNGGFGILDLDTGTYTPLGTSGAQLAGLGVANGTLYGALYVGSATTALYSVNTSNGNLTAIGGSFNDFGGFGSTTSGLYALTDGNNAYLQAIDPATGAVTGGPWLTATQRGTNWDLSTNSSTLYYAGNNYLWTLNTSNGSSPLPTAFSDPVFIGPMVEEGGTLYGINGNYKIYTINPTTGLVTFKADIVFPVGTTPEVCVGLAPYPIPTCSTPPSPPSQVSYFFDLTAAPLNPKFMWNMVGDANSYNAEICGNSSCSSIVLTTSSKLDAWQVVSGLSPNTTYWFQVQSVNACGNGSWSVPIRFTTSSCGYSLLPQAYAYSPQGVTGGTVTVTPSSGSCTWTATSNDSWIHVTSGSSGTGNGSVSYSVDANATGNARTGSITIGGQGFMVRQPKDTFIDGDIQPTFTTYIYAIYAEGITTGCGNGYYCTVNDVTRGQMAAFIIRSLYGENFNYTTTPYFTDVPSDYGFFKYIQKMKDVGITQGCGGGNYCPEEVVTRGQMAAFIIRALYGYAFDSNQTPYFTDVPSDYPSFFSYIQKMKDTGITQGCGGGNYCPTDPVTRGQMAAFLARAFLGTQ